ncbi:MAG: sel1 repeat family protein [Candidatus Coatesbacteria bacterium]|nr:sel1 repeat family protein [Candidatus Coatesbacteria bacterium]
MYFLGYMYMKGHGVSQDDAEAVRWFRKAAEVGDRDGIYHLGKMYYQGKGVDRDAAKALAWYKKAARKRHRGAQDAVDRLEAETGVKDAKQEGDEHDGSDC